MQARYPKYIVLLVEGLVGPVDAAPAIAWMKERTRTLRTKTDTPHVLVYQKERSSGTLAKPRFLSVFETTDPAATVKQLSAPHDHEAVRPLGLASYELLPGLPRAADAKPDGGLMVGLVNCTHPDQHDAFNDWYNKVHAADVIKSPYFWTAQRYRRLAGDLPQYAALYETSLAGSEALKQYMSWPDRNAEMHPRIANLHVWSFDYLAAL